MIQHRVWSVRFKLPALSLLFAFANLGVQAQTPMVQVPFVTNVLGIPTSPYNGATVGTPCSTGLSSTGDGCPGTATTLWYPYGVVSDSSGDLAAATAAGTVGITVLYEGGSAMYNLLVGAKPNYTFTPTAGHAYFLNNGTANLTGVTTGTTTTYYCNGTSGTAALDKYANGCPATYAYFQARSVTMDPDGNIFIGEYEPYQSIRVVYAGGVRAANLIKAYNSAVTTPQVGFIYALSNPAGADFGSIRGVAVQPVNATTENVFASDNSASATATGVDSATVGNQVKEFVCPSTATGCNTAYATTIAGNTNTAAGWVTYIPGTSGGTTYSAGIVVTAGTTATYGDGGVPSAAFVDDPTCLVVDKYGNLYIGDVNDARIRVVYNGGSTVPLFAEGVNSNAYVTPVAGNIYTAVGGATTLPVSPAQGNTMQTVATNIGVDAAGNLLFTKNPGGSGYNNTLWIENVATGLAVNFGWTGAGSNDGLDYTASTAPGAGVPCNGTTGGPTMTDSYGDGCPATEVSDDVPEFSPFTFDGAGNFYITDARVGTYAIAVVHKYTYGNQFGSVAAGSSVTVPFAFTPSVNGGTKTYIPALTFSSTEYTDAGGDLCSTVDGYENTQTCVYNITFKPTRAGSRPGSVTLTQTGTGTLDTIVLGGVGTGAQVAVDPAALSTTGTGLVPAGVAVDTGANVYVADTTSGNVYKSAAGGTPAVFATGLKTPAQVAVSGTGTVFVADKGNNRIASVSSAGGAVTAFLPASFTLASASTPATTASATLSGPQGVAVDLSGNVYVADTGNNRVIKVLTPQGGAGSVNLLLAFTGLSSPQGLAVDASGDVFVADTGNARIVELSAAGVQSAVSVSPSLTTPVGVSLDAAGDLYIADSGTQSVLLVSYGSTSPQTLLGGAAGLAGIAADTTGDVFLAQTAAGGYVELNRTTTAVAYPLTNVGSTAVQTLTLNSTGNATLTTGASLDTGTDVTNFSIAGATTSGCTANESITPGLVCNLAATFQPQSATKFTDTVTFPSSNAVNPATAVLTGTGAKETSTTTTLAYATVAPVTPSGGLPIANTSFNATATIALSTNAGTPTGTVTFTVDGSKQAPVNITVGATITATTPESLSAGQHTILAVYSGDPNYAGSSTSLSFTVVTPQTTKLALAYSLGSPAGSGTTNTTITAQLSAASAIQPYSGTVTFVVDGTTQPAATVSATGAASLTLPLTAGSHTVTANYAGTTYYLTSNSSLTFNVVTGTSSVSLTVAPTGTITFGASVVVTAVTTTGNSTATPTGTIIFTINGATQSVAYAPTAALTLPLEVPGKYTVTASYSGDSNYAAAQSPSAVGFTVVQSPSTTALTAIPNIVAGGNTVTLTATVGPAYAPIYPTGTVTFTLGAATSGPIKVSTSGIATYTVAASTINTFVFNAAYSGDSNYLPSTSTITATPTFSVVPAAPTITMPQNSVAADVISLSPFYGYTGSIKLSCTGLPANTVCAFAPLLTTFAAGNSATQTVTLQIFTNASPLATAGFSQRKGSGGLLLAGYLGLCVCFGLFWKRRRGLGQLSLSLIFLTSVLGLSSCATDTTDHNVYQTPIGVYTVGLTATDGTTTTTTNLSVTVIAGPSTARPN